jgi:hypothetical protein
MIRKSLLLTVVAGFVMIGAGVARAGEGQTCNCGCKHEGATAEKERSGEAKEGVKKASLIAKEDGEKKEAAREKQPSRPNTKRVQEDPLLP